MRDVTDHLRRRIVSGDLGAGRPLPSMRHLAEMYGVSVSTMQGALHALAALGFVQISHGVGTSVSRPRSIATTLVFACLEASPFELAAIRATIDERMPVVAARLVKDTRGGRLPRGLQDLTFLAGDRSHSRLEPTAEAFVTPTCDSIAQSLRRPGAPRSAPASTSKSAGGSCHS
jgi:DNA-binding FadR family transcriptional regulator